MVRSGALPRLVTPSLAVITHSADRFWSRQLLIHLLIQRWREMGVRVEVLCEKDPFVPADAALLHVDLSVVPEECRRLATQYPVVINGRVLDIRKRCISTQQIDAPHDVGPVIVKTDLNHRGLREFQRSLLESPCGPLLRFNRVYQWLEEIAYRVPWQRRRLLRQYPVYANAAQVPRAVWRNPNLIVERFQAERYGANYCCRHWLFFGPREVSRRTVSNDAMVRASAGIEPLADPVPNALRDIRRQFGFDYGKFDYAIISGELVLYDVNRTPGIAGTTHQGKHTETIAVLADGILSYLPNASASG